MLGLMRAALPFFPLSHTHSVCVRERARVRAAGAYLGESDREHMFFDLRTGDTERERLLTVTLSTNHVIHTC